MTAAAAINYTYEKGKLIASGTYGNVYEAEQTSGRDGTKRAVAVKMMPLVYEDVETDGMNHSFIRELNALLRIGRHANIVSLIEYAVKDRDAALVLEKMQCDLYDLLAPESLLPNSSISSSSENSRLTPIECVSLMVQLCTAVERCHAVGIMHRDIKPQNILLNRVCENSIRDSYVLKLADFGQSRPFRADGRAFSTPMTTTLWYCAPEQLVGGQNYGAPNDIWSTGCVLYHLLTRSRKPLFRGDGPLDLMLDIFSLVGYFDDATVLKYADEWKGLSLFFDSKSLFQASSDHKLRYTVTNRIFDPLLTPFASPLYAMLALDPEHRPTAIDVLIQFCALAGIENNTISTA
jgi:serine/threonine protein kinase